MSVKCVAWVFHESMSTGNDRLVLLAIADEADDFGRNAFPGHELIGHKARLPRRTVQRAIARLEGGGELLVKRPDRPGRGRHNRYVVTMGRDPIALAGEAGWPAPALNPEVLEEWRQSVAYPDSGENPVENAEKGAQRRHGEPQKASPGGARPPYPLTQSAERLESGRQQPRRRGLDPVAGEVEAVAATARLRLENLRRTNPCPTCNGDRLVEGDDSTFDACAPCGGTGVDPRLLAA